MKNKKQTSIFVNIETRSEFDARHICISKHCKSPLPMGQENTLCLACQRQFGVTSQAEIEDWQIQSGLAKEKDKSTKQSVDEFLDGLIKAKAEKKVLTNVIDNK